LSRQPYVVSLPVKPKEMNMTIVDILGLLVPVSFFVLLALEALFPARPLPGRRGWRWLGVGFLVSMAVTRRSCRC
jgi:hypothetical protein